MEAEGSLPYSQQPTTGPYAQQHESILHNVAFKTNLM
jgi:hypothetical protein